MGALLAVGAWGPLANLFSGYQDSPAWVYRLYGGPLLVLSVMCFVGSWRSLRRG